MSRKPLTWEPSTDGDESELDGFDKEYVFVLELHDEPNRGVDEVFDEFVGEIYQRPPVKSSVRRRVRKREIHELEPLERDGSRVLGRVLCESGTYIRKLCHDIGLALGVGGHMAELRRTRTGPFDVDESCYIQDLSDAVALWRDEDDASLVYDLIEPVEEVLDEFLPKVVVSDGAVDAVAHGAPVYTSGVRRSEADEGDTAAVYSRSGEAVCVGEVVGGFDDELFLEPGKVLIDPDEREKSWR
ncbi:MAG: RNA-guided pseudouridylation complex pseudouridine synthase subunit Cbf5 [Halobacteria archaeon]|nr:RNA-guided pseudouridylation complex pseudouridine synthase subunit Cbf5 [Halobacteria archaeon]